MKTITTINGGEQMKTISQTGLSLIKSFEGCHLTAYDDLQPSAKLTPQSKLKGTLTIGWGHTSNVYIGQRITQEQADKWLVSDLSRYISHVNNEAYVPLTKKLNQNQFDALVSFCYNCGQENLKRLCYNSTLNQISINMVKYNKSKGITLGGLVKRRYAEQQLFNKIEKGNNTMNEKVEKKITELEKKLKQLEGQVSTLSDKLTNVDAPSWVLEEFPQVLNNVNRKTGTHEFWRAIIVALRTMNEIDNK